jgi:hypothetical protein
LGALKLVFTLGDKEYPFRAWVVRGLQSKALLGQDFGRAYSVVIETSTPSVQIEGQVVGLKQSDDRDYDTQVRALILDKSMYPEEASFELTVVAAKDFDWAPNTFDEVAVKVKGTLPQSWSTHVTYVTAAWATEGAVLTNAVKNAEDLKSTFHLGGINSSSYTEVRC